MIYYLENFCIGPLWNEDLCTCMECVIQCNLSLIDNDIGTDKGLMILEATDTILKTHANTH